MDIKCAYDKLVPIDELVENPKNSEIHPHNEQLIERLAEIIKYQGMRKPLIVSNLSGYIVTGHAVLRALKKLDWKTAPVNFQDFENQDQEMAHLIADNSINTWREINFSAVNEFIPNFDGMNFNIDFLGIKDFVIEPMELYDLDEKPKKGEEDTFILEVEFGNKEELIAGYEKLCSLNYIVKIK